MRTQFTSHGDTAMTIAYDDVLTGLRKSRTFVLDGDHVQELVSIEAHDSLAASGPTLMATAANFQAVMCAQFMMAIQADSKTAATQGA